MLIDTTVELAYEVEHLKELLYYRKFHANQEMAAVQQQLLERVETERATLQKIQQLEKALAFE